MLRLIVKTDDCIHVVNGGASAADVFFKTFDIEAPELEAYLRERIQYGSRQLVGVELLLSEDTAP